MEKKDLRNAMWSMGVTERNADLEYNANFINQVLEESGYRTSFNVGVEDDGKRYVMACYHSEQLDHSFVLDPSIYPRHVNVSALASEIHNLELKGRNIDKRLRQLNQNTQQQDRGLDKDELGR